MGTNILPTYNGRKFNITLGPGYCFAMSLDMAKTFLNFIKMGKPKKLPVNDDLSPNLWAIVQSAYEINNWNNDEKIIEAQGLKIVKEIAETTVNNNVNELVNKVTNNHGVIIFGIMGKGGAHELMWKRDDKNNLWLYLDPNIGVLQYKSLEEAKKGITSNIENHYMDIVESFDAFVLELP